MPTENRSNDADGWIACDDGLHLIQMDKSLSHYGWVFRKVDGGLPYSVREATPHEMAHAQARQHLRIGVAQIAGQAQAPQPHPEPLAWMVGTAFWWTKEEAERDAAATGLPMIPFGPLTGEVEQHPGEAVVLPVCKAKLSMGHDWDQGYADGWRTCLDEIGKLGPLYTRADHGEVERARESHRLHVARLIDERGRFRAQLAEQTALLREIADHCNGCVMPTEQLLREWGSSIDAALSASAELSAPTWSCQPCKIEHPTDRPCDACGGATELKI